MLRRPPRMERLPCDFPLSAASGAKPAILEIFLLETVPISGISAISRATVRSATPLNGAEALIQLRPQSIGGNQVGNG